jgi:hypothetical protein
MVMAMLKMPRILGIMWENGWGAIESGWGEE